MIDMGDFAGRSAQIPPCPSGAPRDDRRRDREDLEARRRPPRSPFRPQPGRSGTARRARRRLWRIRRPRTPDPEREHGRGSARPRARARGLRSAARWPARHGRRRSASCAGPRKSTSSSLTAPGASSPARMLEHTPAPRSGRGDGVPGTGNVSMRCAALGRCRLDEHRQGRAGGVRPIRGEGQSWSCPVSVDG